MILNNNIPSEKLSRRFFLSTTTSLRYAITGLILLVSVELSAQTTGSAVNNFDPADYVVKETINPTKTGFIQKSVNALNLTAREFQLKTPTNPNDNYARNVYFEFDANDIQNIQENNRYTLKFWIVQSYSSALNKPALMEVSGKPGALNDDMTWDTQPAESDLTLLFSKDFTSTDKLQKIEFTGDISPIVNKALESTGSKKFIIRIKEGKGTNGVWHIAGHLYGQKNKRPSVDVLQLRKARAQ